MVLKDKTVKCWGDNAFGALGANSLAAMVSTPTTVLNEAGDGPLTDVDSVVMGNSSSCALLATGQVRCWGSDSSGQLGNDTVGASAPLPVVVLNPAGIAPLSTVVSVAGGYRHYCALLESGEARCWGSNSFGQLGNNSNTSPALPVVVLNETGSAPLTGIHALAAGVYHTCALLQSGEVRCWGANYMGQLGNGGGADSWLPSPVLDFAGGGAPLASAVSLDAEGTQSCVLLASGGPRCWGGRYGSFPLPIPDAATEEVLTAGSSLVTGRSHGCVRSLDNVLCWGSNFGGQLGDGTTTDRYGAALVRELSTSLPLGPVSEVAASEDSSCALVNGYVHCWGYNRSGLLGTLPSSVPVPRARPVLQDVAKSVSAGGSSTCAVLESGKVQCWGSTSDGQIGSGALPSTTVPLPLPVLKADGQELGALVEVVSGSLFSCALSAAGEVWCWGQGTQLGDGLSTDGENRPRRVRAVGGVGYLTSITRLTAGNEHACALSSAGEIVCWGSNAQGQLGDGTTVSRFLPVKVKDASGTGFLSSVTSLATGSSHTCAALSNGEAWCWGYNGYGALGDGTVTRRLLPVRVKDGAGSGILSPVQAITANGSHSCALLSSGQAWCWGANMGGRLGDGTTINRSLPVRVKDAAGTGYLAPAVLVAGGGHTCAASVTGQVWCWGTNSYGMLGDGTTTNRSLPVPVKDEAGTGTLASIIGLSAGTYHTCAFSGSGDAWCWGLNDVGELGDGTTGGRAIPVRVRDAGGTGYLASVTGLAAGTSHTCARLSSGNARCWGFDTHAQLGNGSRPKSVPPSVVKDPGGVEDLASIASVRVGSSFACALSDSGLVWCWGRNDKGQLGDGTLRPSALPVQVRDSAGTGYLTAVSAIAAGDASACAVTTTGEAWCWGSNENGRLGDGTTTTRSLPVRVKDSAGTGYLSSLSAIAARGAHSCAADSSGQMWCWGLNGDGQLGDGTTTARPLPVRVKDAAGTGFLSSVATIATGGNATCARTVAGEAWCWGSNVSGELGDGTYTDRSLPVRVKDESGTGNLGAVQALEMGGSANCALSPAGQAWCWGSNYVGQLGDGGKTPSSLPVRVRDDDGVQLLEPIKALSTSGNHGCAVLNSGEVRCWGLDDKQQVGGAATVINYRTLAGPVVTGP